MATKPKTLVTSAAGKTGKQVTLQLLARGWPVRALVRQTDERSDKLRLAGAEIVQGDLDNPESLRRALEGVQQAYYCAPLLPGALRHGVNFAQAAQQQQLEVVVAMSQWLADATHLSLHTRETALSDTVLRWMPDVRTVVVNPGWFADNYMYVLEFVLQFGMLPMPLGDGLNAPPSNEDIARVVTAILMEPMPHIGRTYRPTGPELLSPHQIAEAFSEVVGRRIRYVDAPTWLFAKVAKVMGFHPYTTAQVLCYLEDYKQNAFGRGAPTDVVERIAGTKPENFTTIARRYVAASPIQKRALRHQAAASWRMLRALAA